ncbi:NAD(P)H-dependent oxidoreductase [Streptomyces sp. NPDC015131]|uniref:NAD(P)H-dependent oxidoreductase n=1 Tax=Streptomyces sp. NPDC015131 TaxID=3364941 RepID=UPI003700E390
MTNFAVIYYSSTGNVHQLAETAAAAGEKAGAQVRLRRAAELFPPDTVAATPAWAEHLAATASVPEAALEDLEWADALLFGTPTRFGLPAAQLKRYLDTTVGLSLAGSLSGKVVSSFTSSSGTHSGQESTLLALNNTFYHWGSLIVPAGSVDPVLSAPANGNPYGVSSVSGNRPGNVGPDNLAAIEVLARRVIGVAAALERGAAPAR